MFQVRIAYGCIAVPCEPGVDGFAQFRRGVLVDTARIGPDIVVVIIFTFLACSENLDDSIFLAPGPILSFIQINLLFAHICDRRHSSAACSCKTPIEAF